MKKGLILVLMAALVLALAACNPTGGNASGGNAFASSGDAFASSGDAFATAGGAGFYASSGSAIVYASSGNSMPYVIATSGNAAASTVVPTPTPVPAG